MIPKDPVMLLSYVNTQLRDFYSSLDALCEDKELSGEEVKNSRNEGMYRILHSWSFCELSSKSGSVQNF